MFCFWHAYHFICQVFKAMALESSELSQQDQSLLACCDENLDKIKFDDCEVYEAQLLGFSTKYLVNGSMNFSH